MQVIATAKIYNKAFINRSCLADEGFFNPLIFQTFSTNQLCNSIIKMFSFIGAIIMRKSISRFFLCSSIFLYSEILSLPTALAMNVGYGIETTVKRKNPLIKELKDFVQNMMLSGTLSNNIAVNPHYSGSAQSKDNDSKTKTNNNVSKTLRVKNIQSDKNVNRLSFSTASSLLKHYNYHKSINGKAAGSSKSIQRESQHNEITAKSINFNRFSHQSTDLDDIDDEDSGIEDIFEDSNPLNAIPILVFSRKPS